MLLSRNFVVIAQAPKILSFRWEEPSMDQYQSQGNFWRTFRAMPLGPYCRCVIAQAFYSQKSFGEMP